MNFPPFRLAGPCLLVALAALSSGIARGKEPSSALIFEVEAGKFSRTLTPFRVEVPAKEMPASVWDALAPGPGKYSLVEIVGEGEARPEPVVAEARRSGTESAPTVEWISILPGTTPAGRTRRFRLDATGPVPGDSPWSLAESKEAGLELKRGDRRLFRYNTSPVSSPKYDRMLTRDAYIHPAFTPDGVLVTGDFSSHHPHHRGIFLAYTKTEYGALHPDFWNIQTGSGKIRFDRLESRSTGPVTARFTVHHRWEVDGGQVALRERWDVEAYDIPGQPYWLFDLTATQRAVDRPLTLVPHRYGGMAYRGPEPFVKGPLDVMTSEGRGRLERDQKPARWVDLTGPVADGSDRYAGVLIADHPSNIHFPNIARIHPILLPFFSYVPGHDKPVTLSPDADTVFRYRVMIHDGRPESGRDEGVARDFGDPPRTTWRRAD